MLYIKLYPQEKFDAEKHIEVGQIDSLGENILLYLMRGNKTPESCIEKNVRTRQNIRRRIQ